MAVITDSDKIAREKIEQELGKNFFVEAGAGSGKTYELVKRMTAMVESGIDVSKICTITFTKAAANEFYSRFQEALASSSSKHALEALKNIDLCFMGTIDSFCNMILKEHPIEAGIPSESVLYEDDKLNAYYLREFSLIQQGKKTPELKEKCRKFNLLFYDAKKVFLNNLKVLLRIRNSHLNLSPVDDREPDEVFLTLKNELTDLFSRIINNPECADIRSKNPEQAFQVLQNDYKFIMGSWNNNFASVVNAIKKIKELRISVDFEDRLSDLGPYFSKYFTEHISRGRKAWYKFDQEKYLKSVRDMNEYRFAYAADFLNDCVDEIAETMKKEGKLTFFDSLLYLRNLLKKDAAEDGKLIRHISERHQYFLIDEFQDTDPLQTEIFFLLTAETIKPDWRECIPRAGSLFIVGDPKQSIYRFKNADVASFLRTKALFSDPAVGEVVELTRNFRSNEQLCQWFNDVFEKLLPEDTDIQSKFHPIPLGEKCAYNGSLSGTYKYSIPNYGKNSENEDFAKVAGIISELVQNSKFTIQDKDRIRNGEHIPNEPRMIDYGDIMVITPRKTLLKYYMLYFADRGIPFYVEGETEFGECPALISISLLMSAIADPYDKKAAFAALYLSGCEITMDEIKQYHKNARTISPAAMFSILLNEKKVFAKAGTTDAEYVFFALELLKKEEITGNITSMKQAAAFLKHLAADSEDDEAEPGTTKLERSLQLQRASNRVRIANLHKVKGLEAPVVILADPSKTRKGVQVHVDYEKNLPESYLFQLKEVNNNVIETTSFDAEKSLEEEVQDSEKMRLKYVAATRAANVLIVADKQYSDDRFKQDLIWIDLVNNIDTNIDSILGTVAAGKTEAAIEVTAEDLYKEAADTSVLADDTSRKKTYGIKRPSALKLKKKISSEDNYEDADPEAAPEVKKREDAPLIGTIVHRLMEALVSSRGRVDDARCIEGILKEYDAVQTEYRTILTNVAEKIRNGGFSQPESSKVPEDILGELLSADEVYCELPFCYKDGSDFWSGIMDVIYCKGQRWYIVDYKTNYEVEDLDAIYQGQLEAYRKAFREMTGNEVEALIYHIDVEGEKAVEKVYGGSENHRV